MNHLCSQDPTAECTGCTSIKMGKQLYHWLICKKQSTYFGITYDM